MPDGSDRVLVGEIVAVHGVRGLVKVRVFTDHPDGLIGYGELSDQAGRIVRLELRGPTKGGMLAAVEGVRDRTQAEALRGTRLYVSRDALPEADEGEFYQADLIGMGVHLADGTVVGDIKAVQNFGAGDLLEVKLTAQSHTVLVPFTQDVVPVVDLEAGVVTVTPVPGLLD